jgi:hypothetical protein
MDPPRSIGDVRYAHIRENYAYCLEINDETKQYLEINRNYRYIGHNTASLSAIVGDTSKWRRVTLYNDATSPNLNDTPATIRMNRIAYERRREELTTGLTLYPPLQPYTPLTTFEGDPVLQPLRRKGHQTAAEKEQSMVAFVAAFEALAAEKFVDGIKDQSRGGFTLPDGTHYVTFSKTIWPDGFTEYVVQRYSVNIFDRAVCPNKTARKAAIMESAFIYPKNMVENKEKSFMIGEWCMKHYIRKHGL